MDTPAQAQPELTLKQRARKGVFWVGVVTIGTKVITVLTTLTLTHFLAPEDFGLVGIAGIIVSALAIFTDLGLGAAIIHSKADRHRMASTAFFIMPIIGLILYALAYLTAPALANILGNPLAVGIIRLIALNIFISSLVVVPSVLLEKDMAYRRKVIPDLVPILIYVPCVLILAIVFHLGAYAIAIGLIFQSLANLILNWILVRWRPSLIFDRRIAGDLIRYGRNVLGGSVIAYLTTNLDNVLVSRLLGPASLGYYTLAYSITNLPATHIADVLGRVLFPSFVELNNDPGRLQKNYARALTVLIVVTFPVLLGLAAIASPFVDLVMGDRWMPLIPVMQALTLFVLFRILSVPTGSLFLATGRSKYILITGITGLVLQGVMLGAAFLLHASLNGVALAIGGAAVINGIIIGTYVRRIIPYKPIDLVRPAYRLIAPAALMGLSVYALTLILPTNFVSLAAELIAGAILYCGFLLFFNGRSLVSDIISLIKREKPAV